MEVDEIDTGLLEQFGSLQTVDHADLVRQMRKLVGGDESISEAIARFYLEMSNWNGKISYFIYHPISSKLGGRISFTGFLIIIIYQSFSSRCGWPLLWLEWWWGWGLWIHASNSSFYDICSGCHNRWGWISSTIHWFHENMDSFELWEWAMARRYLV